MRKHYAPVVALLLLAAAIVIPRLFARALVVRYDLLFSQTHGNGYAPTTIAIGAKLLAAGLVIASLVGLLSSRRTRVVWALMMITSGLAFVSISRPERNLSTVISQGSKLVNQIEAFHAEHGRYPFKLSELSAVPHTGLPKERRFYYASANSQHDDKGHFFLAQRGFWGRRLM